MYRSEHILTDDDDNVSYIIPVNLGQFIVGYSIGWCATIIPKLQDPDQTPLPDVITEQQTSWIGCLLLLGAVVGENAFT